MRRIARLRPSLAMAVAFAALFVAGAGSATAAKLITGKSIKNNSISSTDIKNRSLLAKDFKSGQLKRGATGVQGPAGAAGRAGGDGFGVLRYPAGGFSLPPTAAGEVDFFVNVCPAGTYPTGGDAYAIDNSDEIVRPPDVTIVDGFSVNLTTNRPSGWFAEVVNTTVDTHTLFVDAICANASTPPPPVGTAKAKAYSRLASR